jgi:hypothetical protein
MYASNTLLNRERATMLLVGRTVMEKEETTSLFYSLMTSVATDDPVWRVDVEYLLTSLAVSLVRIGCVGYIC